MVTTEQAKWETHDWSPDTHTCRKCGAPLSTGEKCASGIVSVGVAPDADDIIVRLRRAYDETGNSLFRDAMEAIAGARRAADRAGATSEQAAEESPLARAVKKARGGPADTTRRGFA